MRKPTFPRLSCLHETQRRLNLDEAFDTQDRQAEAVMSESYEHFAVNRAAGILSVELSDPKLFDTAVITEWQNEILRLVDTERPAKMVVDFSKVVHCSTAVINGLLLARKRIVKAGGQLKLCGMVDSIRDSYRLLNLDGTVFLIYETIDEAIANFD